MGLEEFTFNLPIIGSGKWVVDKSQQRAAWEMYVELITRISVQPLTPNEGLLREALSSLYHLFGETRRILREYGPDIAKPMRKKAYSFGRLAVDVLNVWLRPFMTHWHPLLAAHEHKRAAGTSQLEHEQAWKGEGEKMRAELRALQEKLSQYADLLANACGNEPLHGTRAS